MLDFSAEKKPGDALESYFSRYGFDRDPFSDDGVLGLFYPGAGRKQTVDALLHFLRYGTTPVFLVAPRGAGKSTVLREFACNVESDVEIAVVEAGLMMTAGQLLSKILIAFGSGEVAIPEGGNLADRLLERAAAAVANERQVLICIDDAQDLAAEVVDIFFEIVARSKGSLRILWVGDPQTTAVIEDAGHRVNLLVNRIELPALTQQDITDYVIYRMESAGYVGDMPLSALQLQALTHRSQGNFEQLHRVARSMLIASADGAGNRLRPFPLLHTVLIALLLVALFVIWQQRASNSKETAANKPIVLEGVSLVEPDIELQADRDVEQLAEGALEPTISPTTRQAEGQTVVVAGTERTEPDSAPAANEVSMEVSRLEQSETHDRGGSLDSIETLPETVSERLPAPAPEPIEEVAAPPASAVAGGSDPLSDAPTNAAHQRLLAWPELGYALQVFGTHNVKRARQLVDDYFGQADLVYYETRHNDKPWFVVVNGPYTGREAAKQSLSGLPDSIRRLRPWPRNIASIQSDIRRFDDVVGNGQGVQR